MGSVDPVIIRKLAGYGSAIVPPKFVEEQGADYVSSTNMPGTGPYKIVEYKVDDSLTLEEAQRSLPFPPEKVSRAFSDMAADGTYILTEIKGLGTTLVKRQAL